MRAQIPNRCRILESDCNDMWFFKKILTLNSFSFEKFCSFKSTILKVGWGSSDNRVWRHPVAPLFTLSLEIYHLNKITNIVLSCVITNNYRNLITIQYQQYFVFLKKMHISIRSSYFQLLFWKAIEKVYSIKLMIIVFMDTWITTYTTSNYERQI